MQRHVVWYFQSSSLKMEAEVPFETLVPIYKAMRVAFCMRFLFLKNEMYR
jgi:hypothetical protein